MKERISALMDGELDRHESAGAIGALESGGEPRETWRAYHVIGDAMRDTRMLSPGFSGRVVARLDAEPTVLAPRPSLLTRPVAMPAWSALAASLAAVGFVGWVAFAPSETKQGQVQEAAVVLPKPSVSVQEAALVAPPEAAADYLRAHQGYSPRNSFQGAAPYVRVDAEARKR